MKPGPSTKRAFLYTEVFLTRFGTCADIVSYLCKFETKGHQILGTLTKLLGGKSLHNPVFILGKHARL